MAVHLWPPFLLSSWRWFNGASFTALFSGAAIVRFGKTGGWLTFTGFGVLPIVAVPLVFPPAPERLFFAAARDSRRPLFLAFGPFEKAG